MNRPRLESLFATKIYRAEIPRAGALNSALLKTCLAIAAEDGAGQRWAKKHGYKGYTSYASLDDLPTRASVFAELSAHLDKHARDFAKALAFETAGRKLVLDSLWINVLASGGSHSGHIHPHSVLSGTYYVSVPKGASAIRFEDPRLPLMMAAPARKKSASRDNQVFVSVAPKAGTILMWESFLRHEVPLNASKEKRVSVSFNYALK
jgi:uncharacterized protein (TIGR02466 family)